MPPKRSSPPVAPDPDDGLAIEIDPELLEAALASVEKRLARRRDDEDGPSPLDGVAIDLALDVEEPAPSTAETVPDRTPAVEIELREARARAAELEHEVLRMTQLRDVAEDQLREVRKAAREAQADFDRFRARARKDREEAERTSEERLLRQVLDTADNLERAWQHAMSDPASLLDGLQMIVEQFRGVLRRMGVERVDATPGTRFDPEVHEAVMYVASARVEAGAVVDEVSPGYRLKGRLFRPARVTVAAPS